MQTTINVSVATGNEPRLDIVRTDDAADTILYGPIGGTLSPAACRLLAGALMQAADASDRGLSVAIETQVQMVPTPAEASA